MPSLFSRKRARRSHSEPLIEMQLRQIESHYALIAGLHSQIDMYREEIRERLAAARALRKHITYIDHNVAQALAFEQSVPGMEAQIRTLEDSIVGHHETIKQLAEGLDDEALRLLTS